MKYLLDTNMCAYYLKDKYNIKNRLEKVGRKNCAISELTIAEFKYGIEKSDKKYKAKNKQLIETFIYSINVIPLITSFDIYAKEKVRLQKQGNIIDDFDLLIGCTAIAHDMILVTNNMNHFKRLNNIRLENWALE